VRAGVPSAPSGFAAVSRRHLRVRWGADCPNYRGTYVRWKMGFSHFASACWVCALDPTGCGGGEGVLVAFTALVWSACGFVVGVIHF
jgi:hypothetical protein